MSVQGDRDTPIPAEGYQLTVAAVARRLGIAPATLRTWDRRYGLGPSDHRAGAHRRYAAADLGRLAEMRRLTLEGVAPQEAARLVLLPPGEEAPALEPAPARAGGGRSLSLPSPTAVTRGLARAAMSLDSPGCLDLLRRELARRGLIGWWDDVVVPVLVAVGNRHALTGEGIDVEHLLTECVKAVVAGATADPVRSGPIVLLASAEEETHTLPVRVLAATLTQAQVGVRYLGARLPAGALTAAVRRSGPAAVFLWSSLPSTADAGQLSGLPVQRPAPRVVVGGPGWSGATLPPGVRLVGSLAEARDELISAIRVLT